MGTNADRGTLQHDTNCPHLAHPGSTCQPPRLTHFVPPGKEDGRSCKKVTIRMTIRKNECRSNTPVGDTQDRGRGQGGASGEWWLCRPPHWPSVSR